MIKRFGSDERGSVILPAAVLLPAVLLSVAVAADYSNLNRDNSSLQKSADAAALAGAKVFSMVPAALRVTAVEDAKAAAERFMAAQFPDSKRTISAEPADGVVTVSATHEQPLAFANLLGLPSVTVRVNSKAAAMGSSQPCMIALDQNERIGIEARGSASIESTKCSIWSNSSSSESFHLAGGQNLTIKSTRNCAVGTAFKSGPVNVTPEIESRCPPVADPFAGTFTYPTGLPCRYTNTVIAAGPIPVTISPGVYCGGLTIDSRTVVMEPGIYEMRDGPFKTMNNSEVSVLGTLGVTIAFTGSGTVGLDLSGSTNITILGSVSGPLAVFSVVSLQPNTVRAQNSQRIYLFA